MAAAKDAAPKKKAAKKTSKKAVVAADASKVGKKAKQRGEEAGEEGGEEGPLKPERPTGNHSCRSDDYCCDPSAKGPSVTSATPLTRPSRLRGLLTLFALMISVVLGTATAAHAHTGLSSSNPADGSTLTSPVPAVDLTFTGQVLLREVTVTGPAGTSAAPVRPRPPARSSPSR